MECASVISIRELKRRASFNQRIAVTQVPKQKLHDFQHLLHRYIFFDPTIQLPRKPINPAPCILFELMVACLCHLSFVEAFLSCGLKFVSAKLRHDHENES